MGNGLTQAPNNLLPKFNLLNYRRMEGRKQLKYFLWKFIKHKTLVFKLKMCLQISALYFFLSCSLDGFPLLIGLRKISEVIYRQPFGPFCFFPF